MTTRYRPCPSAGSLARAVLAGAVLVAGGVVAAPGAGAQTLPPDDAARGVIHAGLATRRPTGPCPNAFVLAHATAGRTMCTHGPDPGPAGVDVRTRRPPRPTTAAATLPGSAPSSPTPGTAAGTSGGAIQCYDDGTSGPRVQLVYARASNVADRYADFATTFRQAAADVDQVFAQSAAETGGVRHVRFVTDSTCTPTIERVTLSTTGDDNIDNTVSEVQAQGYTRADRKYLVFVDANVYCGIAQIYDDDKPTSDNSHNANATIPGMVARVDNGCWDLAGQSVEAHELMHTLGGVQFSAPHATHYNHCTDDNDRMCYSDGSGQAVSVVCTNSAHENAFDCNHDDYFSTSPAASSYLATHWNSANSSFLASTAGTKTSATGARYHPLTPSRILDTRTANGVASAAPVGKGASIDLQVSGRGGVPSANASAVVMNITATNPTATSYLTVYPTGETMPLASNLNVAPGQTVPNLVTAKLGTGGKVTVFNAAGSTDVIADVAGWYDDGTLTSGARYHALTPSRILDTRNGTGAAAAAPLGQGGALDLQVSGRGGVPSTGVGAVTMNVTATNPTATGYVTVYPTGESRPVASNLNVAPGQTAPNLVIAKLGTGGKVTIYNATGSTDVVADVSGWYDDGTATSGAFFHPLTPSRILDTRSALGALLAPLLGTSTIDVQVTGRGGVPSSGVTAAVMNVTVTDTTVVSFLTVYPAGETRPLASNLNFVGGQTVPNLVTAKLGTGGKVTIFNSAGSSDVIADVGGYFDDA